SVMPGIVAPAPRCSRVTRRPLIDRSVTLLQPVGVLVPPSPAPQSGGMIPVLRLDHARAADGTFASAFLDDLRSALHEVGFLQLTDFGAAPGQVADLTRRFFDLPQADRLALDNRLSPHFRGYTRLGHEITAGRPDAREQLDFAPEQPAPPRREWDAPYRLLEGPNQWPDARLPELREVVMAWADLLGRVGTELTHALAACLGLPEGHFDGVFAGAPHW